MLIPTRLRRSRLARLAFVACLAAVSLAAASPARRAPSRTHAAAHPAAPAPARVALSEEARLERDTLAWVGDRAITALDLVERIEWMPWVEKNGAASMDSAKVHALESLVAEALLAKESERATPGDSLTPQRGTLLRALTRDALYKQVVADVPRATPAQIERIVRARSPHADTADLTGLRRSVRDSLITIADRERAGLYLMSKLSGSRMQVDSTTFVLFADSLRSYMVRQKADPVPGGGRIVPAEAADLLAIELRPALDRTLVRMPDGPLTLGDALADLHFYLFAITSLEQRRFDMELSTCLKRIVEGEMMAREGARQHLDRLPSVQHDLRVWTGAWRAQGALEGLVRRTQVTDDDAFRTLAIREPLRARQVCEVDLSEILCASRAEAQELFGEIQMGARFDSIATLRSRRSEWAARGGRSGFFPVLEHPTLGFDALLALPDSLTGPFQLDEGYALLEVHGKRLVPDSSAAPGLLKLARAAANAKLRMQVVAEHVASLAEQSTVHMDYAALKRVEIFQSSMVVKRSLGFGGGMTASPMLTPMWQWTGKWSGHATQSP